MCEDWIWKAGRKNKSWGVFKSLWPRKTGSANCLIRTIFFGTKWTTDWNRKRGKWGSENVRMKDVKERGREQKAWESKWKRERKRTKAGERESRVGVTLSGSPFNNFNNQTFSKQLIGSRWGLPHSVQLCVVLIGQENQAWTRLPLKIHFSHFFWSCLFLFNIMMYWQIGALLTDLRESGQRALETAVHIGWITKYLSCMCIFSPDSCLSSFVFWKKEFGIKSYWLIVGFEVYWAFNHFVWALNKRSSNREVASTEIGYTVYL